MIKIDETPSEYLLFIPAFQKDRAKAIDGRRWDPERKCWVYPRTARVYDALVAEFGDEGFTAARPEAATGPDQKTQEDLQNKFLKDQLAQLQGTVDALLKASSENNETKSLREALASRDQEIASVHAALRQTSDQLEATRRDYAAVQLQIGVLKRRGTLKHGEADFLRQAKEVAVHATGNDPEFSKAIERLSFDATFPIEISKIIEKHLRKLLGINDRGLSLYDLLAQARDSEKLSEEGVDLAHTIRRQRNIAAHEQIDNQTHTGRVMVVLFASAVLWRQLQIA